MPPATLDAPPAGRARRVRPEPIPPLRDGDRLRWPEYIRRYEAMPDGFRAELLDGTVHVRMSALRVTVHGEPHRLLEMWAGVYQARTPGVRGGTAATVNLTVADAPEPDGVLYIDPRCAGSARVSPDGYLTGPAELLVEIGASSINSDLGEKRERYRAAGVREYLVLAPERGELYWYRLDGAGRYKRVKPTAGGLIRSGTFPGLWLNVPAAVSGDFSGVLDALEAGLASPEHAAFAAANRAALRDAGELDAAGESG